MWWLKCFLRELGLALKFLWEIQRNGYSQIAGNTEKEQVVCGKGSREDQAVSTRGKGFGKEKKKKVIFLKQRFWSTFLYCVTFSSPSHKVPSEVSSIFFAAGAGIFFSEYEVWAQGSWWVQRHPRRPDTFGLQRITTQWKRNVAMRQAHWLHWGKRGKNTLGSGCRGSGHCNCYMYSETVY